MRKTMSRSSTVIAVLIGRVVVPLVIFVAIVSFGCTKPHLTDEQMKAAAKEQAEQGAKALLSGDYDGFASRMHPKVLDGIGGKEGLLRILKRQESEMKSQGMAMHSATMGDVTQLKTSNSDVFAIVPQTIEISVPGGILKSEGYLLAISADAGKTWTFADGAGLKNLGGKLRTIFPNLPSDLELPKKKEPVFIAAGSQAPSSAKRSPSVPNWEAIAKGAAAPDTEQGQDDLVIAVAAAPPMMDIERSDYRATVPRASVIDAKDPEIDLDHYTVVNLPDGNTLMILVVDDKKLADSAFQKMIDSFKGNLKEPVERGSDLVDARHGKATVVSGKLNGIEHSIEAGLFTGKQKAFVVAATYRPSQASGVRTVLRQCVDSFLIKE